MVHLDLFSGIGGIALAARWAGFDTRLFCEIDPYCRRVLARHWSEVPIHGDIRTLDRKALRAHGIERPALLTGGFPCQPFSCAGKRRGAADDRHLWPEMFRVVRQCRPAWVVGENVAGFVRLGLDGALADLEGEGYECRAFVLPACAVGAPHQRMRCFVVARDTHGHEQSPFAARSAANGAEPGGVRRTVSDAASRGFGLLSLSAGNRPPPGGGRSAASSESGGDAISDAKRHRLAEVSSVRPRAARGRTPDRFTNGRAWQAESRICRVADGVPRRVDRLRGLGNAVVPQQIYPILAGIASIERAAARGMAA